MRRSVHIPRIPVFAVLSALVHTVAGGWIPCCRFSPSCSQYADQAFREFGFWRGLLLTSGRLWRCRPGGRQWGYDPLPHLGPSASESEILECKK